MSREGRRARTRSLVLAFSVAAASVVGLTGCGESRGDESEQRMGEPRPVTFGTVTARTEPVRLTYAGEVVAGNRVDVASKATGNVVELPVTEGTTVTRGTLLARIDAPELTTALTRARAGESAAKTALTAAERQAERFRRLAAEGVVTPRDLELVEIDAASAAANHEAARAQRVIAERNMAYAEVRAPFDGVVVSRFVRLGDLATPGRPLLVIEDAMREIRASVPAELGPEVQPGDSVRVELGDGQRQMGHVDRVQPDASRHVREIWVRAEGLERPSGTFVSVGIAGDALAPALTVPTGAIRRRGSLTSVFVVQEARAVLRYVRLDGNENVISGLEAGEVVIVSPPSDLRDGDPVTDAGHAAEEVVS